MSLTILALLAAPAAPQHCVYDNRVFVDGVVASVTQAPAAPFDMIAVGEPCALTLSFATDVLCSTPAGLDGFLATPDCCELTIAGASALLDPTSDPCLWGEQFVLTPTFYTELVSADAAFGDGQVRALLQMTDPQGVVGIGTFNLTTNAIDVASVTAPGFSVSLTLVDAAGALLATIDVLELSGAPGFQIFGASYCTAVANSTGIAAFMGASGSVSVTNNNLRLQAYELPQGSFGYFLVSAEQAFIQGLPNSDGNLCVGGAVGRFVGPGQILNSGNDTFVGLDVDLALLPTPTGLISVQPGDTWNFTYWYRDFTTELTSNFANGLSLVFQ